MIITLTANPSLDRTVELAAPLVRGGVQRAVSASRQAAGKGVNVSRVLAASGLETLAILPGDPEDEVPVRLRLDGLAHLAVPVGADLRSNITLTEPDGTTTKINEPGPVLPPARQEQLAAAVVEKAAGAAWLVLAGSLPPGVPAGFYATLVAMVRGRLGEQAPRIAVDTSGDPLRALFAAGPEAVPDLVKPNAEELAELTGRHDEAALEADPALAAAAAKLLLEDGAGAVLATLGSKGAVLATPAGSWFATHAPITARSTVGAGDSSLAGYLLAHSRGGSAPDCLRQAVAHGAAAAALPGTTLPALNQTTPDAVVVTAL
ncbi:1-phosphofructokinase family hexose kinase [Arthrobacter mobilis]|uniref:Hexose kinase n=1 Tax=Arthrobacter mobilis TaxID=2724944 RepID=A0A7X6K6I4_9MICC|nr:hexose kinase [Arthrobacter mobilis]NKX55058.1 hexose kinase [Arthrobacter mobilis]